MLSVQHSFIWRGVKGRTSETSAGRDRFCRHSQTHAVTATAAPIVAAGLLQTYQERLCGCQQADRMLYLIGPEIS